MLSSGDADVAGVGCSAGCGIGAPCAGRGVAPSGLGDLVGCGFGVFSGSGVDFFLPAAACLSALFFGLLFFFPVLDFGVAEGVLEGFGNAVVRRDVFSSSSESDFFFPAELFGFGVSDSFASDLDLAGVFFG